MNHPDYQALDKKFRHTAEWRDDVPLRFPAEGIDLYHLAFASAHAHFLLGRPGYTCPEHGLTFPGEMTGGEPSDTLIEQNIRFRYPLLSRHPGAGPVRKQSRVLVLLHGLNERRFAKYLPWAYQLCLFTGNPVILFPMTFHINRVSPQWARLQQESYLRRQALPGNEHGHRFNAIISDRLGSAPERFFWGAMQTYWDLVELVRLIRRGEHSLIAPTARIDFLGYSAGGYIALALLLENHESLFTQSRAILFATGASVRDTTLSSHFIVDLMAEIALMKQYVKYRERLCNARLHHWLEQHGEGQWLNAFCGLIPGRVKLEPRLHEISLRLLGISNLNDHVMPPGAMLNALQGTRRDTGVRIEELEMGVHENPFASPDYDQPERWMITEFLDQSRYGAVFEEFITMCARHLC